MPEVLLAFATIIAPIILALVEVIKRTVNIPTNYIPALSVLVGLVVGFAAQPFTDLDLVLRLWAGVIAGLSATGIYEAFTKTNSKGDVK